MSNFYISEFPNIKPLSEIEYIPINQLYTLPFIEQNKSNTYSNTRKLMHSKDIEELIIDNIELLETQIRKESKKIIKSYIICYTMYVVLLL